MTKPKKPSRNEQIEVIAKDVSERRKAHSMTPEEFDLLPETKQKTIRRKSTDGRKRADGTTPWKWPNPDVELVGPTIQALRSVDPLMAQRIKDEANAQYNGEGRRQSNRAQNPRGIMVTDRGERLTIRDIIASIDVDRDLTADDLWGDLFAKLAAHGFSPYDPSDEGGSCRYEYSPDGEKVKTITFVRFRDVLTELRKAEKKVGVAPKKTPTKRVKVAAPADAFLYGRKK